MFEMTKLVDEPFQPGIPSWPKPAQNVETVPQMLKDAWDREFEFLTGKLPEFSRLVEIDLDTLYSRTSSDVRRSLRPVF